MNTENLENEYTNLLPRLTKFKNRIVSELNELLTQNAIQLAVPIESRVKSWQSIAAKVDRKDLELTSITQLVDLLGIRLVLPFLRDVSLTTRLLESAFDIKSKEEKLADLDEAQFGYQSTHLEASLSDSWSKLPSFQDCSDYGFELQVRTMSQHTWAIVSHKLQYKQESSVPFELKRSINRMAALLETVDLEFERTIGQHEQVLQEFNEPEPDDEALTLEVFLGILDEYLPKENSRSSDKEGVIDELFRAGVSTRKQLISLFNAYTLQTVELEKYLSKQDDVIELMKDAGRDEFHYADIGFVRRMLNLRAHDIQDRLLQRNNKNSTNAG